MMNLFISSSEFSPDPGFWVPAPTCMIKINNSCNQKFECECYEYFDVFFTRIKCRVECSKNDYQLSLLKGLSHEN